MDFAIQILFEYWISLKKVININLVLNYSDIIID